MIGSPQSVRERGNRGLGNISANIPKSPSAALSCRREVENSNTIDIDIQRARVVVRTPYHAVWQ